MIKSREDLLYQLNEDKKALEKTKKGPQMLAGESDLIQKFEITLRKSEYYTNCKRRSLGYYYKYKLSRLSIKLGYSIPSNMFGEGLAIAHIGTIVVNGYTKVGKNCRIQTGVTLGATNGTNDSPIIGDNVFLGDGAKVIGGISIADDVCIGANAVVVKSINEAGTTWAGVPARKVSEKNSHNNLSKLLEL